MIKNPRAHLTVAALIGILPAIWYATQGVIIYSLLSMVLYGCTIFFIFHVAHLAASARSISPFFIQIIGLLACYDFFNIYSEAIIQSEAFSFDYFLKYGAGLLACSVPLLLMLLVERHYSWLRYSFYASICFMLSLHFWGHSAYERLAAITLNDDIIVYHLIPLGFLLQLYRHYKLKSGRETSTLGIFTLTMHTALLLTENKRHLSGVVTTLLSSPSSLSTYWLLFFSYITITATLGCILISQIIGYNKQEALRWRDKNYKKKPLLKLKKKSSDKISGILLILIMSAIFFVNFFGILK